MRICSLLPSATEIVYAMGMGDHLVAVTHECDYPPRARSLPAITRSAFTHEGASSREIHNHIAGALHQGSSIYHLDQELLARLDPDLIITQELCDVCAVSYGEVRKAVRLLSGDRRVISLEPTSLGGILETVRTVGDVTGASEQAAKVTRDLQARIDRVVRIAANASTRPRVFAMEWLDPPFVGGHWVPEMVRLAGGADGLGREGRPTAVASREDIARYDPEVVVLMPCGFDLARNIEEFGKTSMPPPWHALQAVRTGQVYAVDGSAYFNRPGPRIVDGLEILAEIIHPELFPRSTPAEAWKNVGAKRSTTRG